MQGTLGLQTMQAALTDMSIPAVEVSAAEGNDEPELEVSDDPSSAVKLDTSKVPILLTVSQACMPVMQADNKSAVTCHHALCLVLLQQSHVTHGQLWL